MELKTRVLEKGIRGLSSERSRIPKIFLSDLRQDMRPDSPSNEKRESVNQLNRIRHGRTTNTRDSFEEGLSLSYSASPKSSSLWISKGQRPVV